MCLALATREQALEWVNTQKDGLSPPPAGNPARESWQRRLIEATALLSRDALVRMAREMPASSGPHFLSHPDTTIQMTAMFPSKTIPRTGPRTGPRPDKPKATVSLSISIPPSAYPYRGSGEGMGSAAYVHVSAPLETLGLPDALLKAALDGTLFGALSDQTLGIFNIPLDEDITSGVLRYMKENPAWAAEFVEKKMAMNLPAAARLHLKGVGRL